MLCPSFRFLFITGALFCFLAVTAGAFGSHFLKNRWTTEQLSTFEIAVRYQMYHGLALLAVAIASTFLSSHLIQAAGSMIVLGILIFSGSLYLLLLTGLRWWGAVTPIGGLLLLVGWTLLMIGGWVSKSM